MNKYEIAINDLPNKVSIEKELTTSLDPHKSKQAMVDVIKFSMMIEEEKKKMKDHIKEAEAKIKALESWVADRENDYAKTTIAYLNSNPDAYKEVEKTWVNEETGEVKVYKKKERNLPKYISVSETKKELTYNEELIPEEYFKKTVKKTEVKAAIKDGKLPQEVLTETIIEEKSSHISDRLAFIQEEIKSLD